MTEVAKDEGKLILKTTVRKMRNLAKGLTNLKDKDNECFRWCNMRNLNPQEKYSRRIKRCDKEFIKKLNYSGIEFLVNQNQYNKIDNQWIMEKNNHFLFIYPKKNLKINICIIDKRR